MLSIDDLRFFATLAMSPSLTAAARDLGVTPPAVTQRLRLLETKLRVSLVERSTRHLQLTNEGQLLAQRGRRILDEVSELTNDLSARQGDVAGQLRIVAPFGFGRRFIAPMAADFCKEHPRVTLSLILSESPARLGADSWDLLVHVGELKDSSLVVHRLAPNDRLICAAPSYLAQRGEPTRPEDLKEHDCAALRENDEDVTLWRFRDSGGKIRTARIDPHLSSNDGEIVRRWALAGLGIIMRSEWDVAEDIREGRLVRILGHYQLASADIVVLLGASAGRTARTARFLQCLSAAFVRAPWRL
jgi:DNA-binding transcriptional LysR family regulator